jgi:phytoene synthase
MDEAVRLARSDDYCRELSRTQAKNFYYGMKLTPPDQRRSMFALYAWMRRADDLADESGDAAGKEAALRRFEAQTDQVIDGDAAAMGDDPLWPAVRRMVLEHRIPRQHLHDMIAGQLLDQRVTCYATFDQLYDYCYKVASVVGLCCLEIWGYDGGAETRRMAEWRGVAFQLTNILRDVAEDARRDRVYLPGEWCGGTCPEPSTILGPESGRLGPGLTMLAARAEEYYRRSEELDQRVHPGGRACLWAMTQIYLGLLRKMLPDPSVALRRRVRLSGWRKGWIALRATWRSRT